MAKGSKGTKIKCEMPEATEDNEERADDLRQQLRDNIKALQRRRQPLNVLIIGKPCQGKSAFILSCMSAGLKKWGHYLNVGKDHDKSFKTACLRRLNMLNPQEDHTNVEQEEVDENDEEEILRKHCPRFFDLAGMPDEDNKGIEEVLRRILYGGIPLGTPMLQVMSEVRGHYGPSRIRKKYWKSNRKLRIDRVVVVSSSIEDNPTLMVKALMRAAQPKGLPDPHNGCIYTRTVPVFGLVTMMDKVQDRNDVELATFKSKELDFQISLGLMGSLHHYGRCTNYFTDEEVQITRREMVNDPKKDCPILRFLDYVFDPDIKVDNDLENPKEPSGLIVKAKDVYLWLSDWLNYFINWLSSLSMTQNMHGVRGMLIGCLIGGVLVAIFLLIFLKN